MPLPDAIKRSPRVYTLLQNLDLENVTADTLADVADPISIEEANEDELRRLCLVAFARMVTKGSFDGWLTAGGSSLKNIVPTGGTAGRGVGISLTNNMHGTAKWSANSQSVYITNWRARPFYSVSDATLATIKAGIAGAGSAGTTYELAIYSSDSNGHPDALQSTGEIDTASTGIQSATMEAVAGGSTSITENTLYWVAYRGTGAPVTTPYLNIVSDAEAFPLFMGEFAGSLTSVTTFGMADEDPAPSTWATADVQTLSVPMLEGVLT